MSEPQTLVRQPVRTAHDIIAPRRAAKAIEEIFNVIHPAPPPRAP